MGGRERRACLQSSRRHSGFLTDSTRRTALFGHQLRFKSNTKPDVVRPLEPIGRRLRWGELLHAIVEFAQLRHLAQPLRTKCRRHRHHVSKRQGRRHCDQARASLSQEDPAGSQLPADRISEPLCSVLGSQPRNPSVPSSAVKPQRQAQKRRVLAGSSVAAWYGCANSNYGKARVQPAPRFSFGGQS